MFILNLHHLHGATSCPGSHWAADIGCSIRNRWQDGLVLILVLLRKQFTGTDEVKVLKHLDLWYDLIQLFLYSTHFLKDHYILHCIHMLSLPQIWTNTELLNIKKKKKRKPKSTFKEARHQTHSDISYTIKWMFLCFSQKLNSELLWFIPLYTFIIQKQAFTFIIYQYLRDYLLMRCS